MLPPSAPDLASLDLYLSVIELGSLSRAAKAHGLAQPTASERIRHLERRLGVQLLVRTHTGSTPTATGAAVAKWATAAVQATLDLVEGVSALREDGVERLTVAASYTLGEYVLPAWLEALHRRRPGITVELEVGNSSAVLDRLLAGTVDIGFIESPGGTRGLASMDVGHDELVLVVAPSHPWTRRRKAVPAAVLAQTPLVLREEGSGTRDALASALAAVGLASPGPTLQLGSTAAVRSAVAAGAGAAVLSRLTVENDVAAGRLAEVPVTGVDLRRRLRAVWRADAAYNAAAAALIELAAAAPPSGHLRPAPR